MLFHTPVSYKNGRLPKKPSGTRTAPTRIFPVLARLGLATLGYQALVGCSLLVKDQLQCESSADCAVLGEEYAGAQCRDNICVAEVGPDYTCLGSKQNASMGGDVVMVDARFSSLGSDKTPPGLLVRICNSFDLECTDPVDELTPDDRGRTVLPLPLGFTGHVEIVSEETVPVQLLFPHPVNENTVIVGDGMTAESRVPLFSELQLKLLVQTSGLPYDSDRATLLMSFRDCAAEPAPGVYAEVPEEQDDALLLYVESQIPDTTRTETGKDAQLALVNIKPGLMRFAIRERSSDRLLMSVSLPARPGKVLFLTGSPNQ